MPEESDSESEIELELEFSSMSQGITVDGKTVQVEIYRFEGDQRWCLEVSDEYGNSSVWDDTFNSDTDALEEVNAAIKEESIDSFIGPADGKSDGEWR